MPTAIEPLGTRISALMYFGDAVFALSGALLAGRKRMDIIGFVLIGTITGIGCGIGISFGFGDTCGRHHLRHSHGATRRVYSLWKTSIRLDNERNERWINHLT